jgi:hypothetical protein
MVLVPHAVRLALAGDIVRVFIHEPTHNGDPDRNGWFGVEDCMGSVRNREFDAVIGIDSIGDGKGMVLGRQTKPKLRLWRGQPGDGAKSRTRFSAEEKRGYLSLPYRFARIAQVVAGSVSERRLCGTGWYPARIVHGCLGAKTMSKIGRMPTRREVLILGGLALGVGSLTSVAEAAERHPKIRVAITDLREAREYLKTAASNFGGHKSKAIKRIDEAIDQLEICLKY